MAGGGLRCSLSVSPLPALMLSWKKEALYPGVIWLVLITLLVVKWNGLSLADGLFHDFQVYSVPSPVSQPPDRINGPNLMENYRMNSLKARGFWGLFAGS